MPQQPTEEELRRAEDAALAEFGGSLTVGSMGPESLTGFGAANKRVMTVNVPGKPPMEVYDPNPEGTFGFAQPATTPVPGQEQPSVFDQPRTLGQAIQDESANVLKQTSASMHQAAAGSNQRAANIAMMLDRMAKGAPEWTGANKIEFFKNAEDYFRSERDRMEQEAAQEAGGRQDFPSKLMRAGAGAMFNLPQMTAATTALGPVGGMAALGALENADQGVGGAAKAAAQGALAGKFFHMLGPAGRLMRVPAVVGWTYGEQIAAGVDHETALANALNMGAMAFPGQKEGPGLGYMARNVTKVPENVRGAVGDISLRTKSTRNPLQKRAVGYALQEGIPLTASQITGNRYLQASEASVEHAPLGAQAAQEFRRGTEEGIVRKAGELADEGHPQPVTPYEGGKAASTALESQIAELSPQIDESYRQAWQGAGKPEYTERVIVERRPVLDEGGKPTGQTEPVYRDVNMPVDVRWMKDIGRREISKYEYGLSTSELSQSKAYNILKKILEGPDYITAEQAEESLKGLKAESRKAESPDLRNVAEGTAAQLIPDLQRAVDAAVAKTGQEAVEGLKSGRKLHAEKMEIAEVADLLREEPVQTFGQLTMAKDAGIERLKQVEKRAPGIMPQLGRAYLDQLFELATREGGWTRAKTLFNQWENLGEQTKRLLFPNESQREALDRFFFASKMMGEIINPSGTAMVQAAQKAGLNPFKWLEGWVGSKLLFTPKGIKFLTGVAQDPPRTAAESARVKAQAAKIFGPPEEPGEPTAGPGGGAPPPDERSGGGGIKFGAPHELGKEPSPGEPPAIEQESRVIEPELHDQLQQIADEAAQRIKDRGIDKEGFWSGERGESALDPRMIKDLVQWGAAKLAQGLTHAPTWRAAALAQFGQIPRDKLNELYIQAKEHEINKNVKDWKPGMKIIDIHPLTGEVIPKVDPRKLSTEDVQKYLHKRVIETVGQVPFDAPAEQQIQRMVGQSRKEFKDQMTMPYTGLDWYGPDTRLGDRQLREHFPELRERPMNTIQKAMSAAMSNNSNPLAEAFNGARIWQGFRESGFEKFPMKQPNGKNWPAQGINFQIAKMNRLIDELGYEEAANFLLERHPGHELKHFVPNIKEIRLGEFYPGSRILGPKIGRYFNDMMDIPQEGSTVDVWEMRRKGRILGQLYNARGKLIESPRTEGERNLVMNVHEIIARENAIQRRQAQSVGWHYEQGLYRRLGLNPQSYRRSLGIQKFLESLGK